MANQRLFIKHNLILIKKGFANYQVIICMNINLFKD